MGSAGVSPVPGRDPSRPSQVVADLVPQALRGTAYGVFNTALGIAALPASLIAGILWDGLGPGRGLGPAAPSVFGAALAQASATLLMVWSPDP